MGSNIIVFVVCLVVFLVSVFGVWYVVSFFTLKSRNRDRDRSLKPIVVEVPLQSQPQPREVIYNSGLDLGGIQQISPQKVAKVVIEQSDIDYYRKKNADVMEAYNQRKKEYPVYDEQKWSRSKQKKQRVIGYDDYDDMDDVEMDEIIQRLMLQFQNGSQSVHDSVVQSQVKEQYSELSTALDTVFTDSKENIATQIIQYANTLVGSSIQNNIKLSPEKRTDIEYVLKKISDRNSTMSSLDGDREMDAVAKVWNTGDQEIRRQLLNELVDCKQEHMNDIYCPTGVVTRVMNSLNIKEPEHMSKTREVLRGEMLQTAANVRNKMETSDTKYNTMNEEKQNEYFKDTLQNLIYAQYDGVIPKEKLQKEMDEWIDSV